MTINEISQTSSNQSSTNENVKSKDEISNWFDDLNLPQPLNLSDLMEDIFNDEYEAFAKYLENSAMNLNSTMISEDDEIQNVPINKTEILVTCSTKRKSSDIFIAESKFKKMKKVYEEQNKNILKRSRTFDEKTEQVESKKIKFLSNSTAEHDMTFSIPFIETYTPINISQNNRYLKHDDECDEPNCFHRAEVMNYGPMDEYEYYNPKTPQYSNTNQSDQEITFEKYEYIDWNHLPQSRNISEHGYERIFKIRKNEIESNLFEFITADFFKENDVNRLARIRFEDDLKKYYEKIE